MPTRTSATVRTDDTGSGPRHLPAIDIDDQRVGRPGLRAAGLPRPGSAVPRPASAATSPARGSTGRRRADRSEVRAGQRLGGADRLDELRSGVTSLRRTSRTCSSRSRRSSSSTSACTPSGSRTGPATSTAAAGTAVSHRVRAVLRHARPATLPQMNMMAIPGEEPPQIECNEDAGLPDDDVD